MILALCRRGSLKAAAGDLGVNIATVSRRLDAVETATGQHLFDRTPDGTRPTAAAELMLPFAEQMERAVLELGRALEGLEAEPEGLVRVTAPPGLVDQFLAGMVAELTALYPRICVELLSTIGYADLSRREADIALRSVRPTSGDLVSLRLGTADYVLVASPAYATELGRLADLNDARWVTYTSDLGHLPEVAWVTGQVAAERIALRTNSLTAQLQAVRAGLGVKLEARPFLALHGLAEVRVSRALARTLPPTPETSLWLVGHRALRDVPRIAAVWEFLVDQFGAALSSSRGLR